MNLNAPVCQRIQIYFGIYGKHFILPFRERDREYRRKAKVKMTAAKLAGVYVDTTTREKLVPDDEVIFSREDYKSLQKYKIPYDDISDEEL